MLHLGNDGAGIWAGRPNGEIIRVAECGATCQEAMDTISSELPGDGQMVTAATSPPGIWGMDRGTADHPDLIRIAVPPLDV